MFVGSDIFRQASFGSNHPLAFSRISGVIDICKALNWLPNDQWIEVDPAPRDVLMRLHDHDYIEALFHAVERGSATPEDRMTYHIGTMENPIFPNLFNRAATTVAGSIKAAELALKGHVTFHPSGGTHHGRNDRASGFCYFNDPAYAVQALLDGGAKSVLYLDIDAHHGDGVQDYFQDDPRVWTFSIHEEGRWPYSGALDDIGRGRAINLPVPKGCHDADYKVIVEQFLKPFMAKKGFEAAVITCGADALAGDPLSSMELSNTALWHAVDAVTDAIPHVAILGGGGYNPWTTIRCWAGLWGHINGHAMPDHLPVNVESLLQKLDSDLVDDEDRDPHWMSRLDDAEKVGKASVGVSQALSVLAKRLL